MVWEGDLSRPGEGDLSRGTEISEQGEGGGFKLVYGNDIENVQSSGEKLQTALEGEVETLGGWGSLLPPPRPHADKTLLTYGYRGMFIG